MLSSQRRATRCVNHSAVRRGANHDNRLDAFLLQNLLEIGTLELIDARRDYRLGSGRSQIFGDVSRLAAATEAEDHWQTRGARRRQ